MKAFCLCLALLGCSTQQWDATFLKIAGYNTAWDKKHLPIKIHSNACASHFSLCEAALEINRLVGMQLFTIVKSSQLPNLVVKTCKSCGGDSVLHFKNQYIVGAAIKLQKLDKQKARLIALHELGHVLGLAHDTDPTSIMHKKAGSFFVKNKQFTRLDVQALRKAYQTE